MSTQHQSYRRHQIRNAANANCACSYLNEKRLRECILNSTNVSAYFQWKENFATPTLRQAQNMTYWEISLCTLMYFFIIRIPSS